MPRVARGTVCVCKGERATWHFLGRIPQGSFGVELQFESGEEKLHEGDGMQLKEIETFLGHSSYRLFHFQIW